MAKQPYGMAPASGIHHYSEVSWYRRQWFIVVTMFFFWPAMLVITLSGDVYVKANRKIRKVSDDPVWKYTSNGKTLLVVGSIFLGMYSLATVFSG